MTKFQATAGVIIKQDGKYLLIQERNPKAYGLWNMPAGYVDPGETLEQAAIREAREETGFEVELDRLVGEFNDGVKDRYAYAAHIVGGKMNPDPKEIMQAKWLTFEEIEMINEAGQFRAHWIYDFIAKYQASVTSDSLFG